MPSQAEINTFRRLIGDFGKDNIDNEIITSYLNDATYEVTTDFVNIQRISAPVVDFDNLVVQYHIEVVYLAAINWWWNKLGSLTDKHSQTVGDSSQSVSEKWDRAKQMIDTLTLKYLEIQQLGTDVTMGNLSYFNKRTLTRTGGQPEEDAVNDLY